MNRDYQNYNLLTDLTGNDQDLSIIINSANAKYNNSFWRTITDVLPASRSKKFSTVIEETGIIVKASVIGSMGEKPLRSFEGGAGYVDSLPKIGHGFVFDQSDLNNIEELNLVDADMALMAANKYRNRTISLLGGFHATWNGWIYQALADQVIRLDNLGGATISVDLHTKSTHKLKAKGTAGWFTSATTAKISDDLIRMNKTADDANMSSERMYVCSKVLYDKIAADAGILASIKATMPWSTADTYLSPKRVMASMSSVFDIPMIVSIDEVSRIEIDGIPTSNPTADFDTDKISLVPITKLFNMHNSPSDYTKDTNPAAYKATAEGGLIGSIQLFASEPISVRTNFESWSFPTFKNPDMIVSLDSSLFSETGL